ncbi:MAG: type II toxin-antitoxin system HicA family toxin [Candidatus Kapaibacteriota bacterium]|jgi:predicted RNA binding protein YcfA (HicA-like mRNA interferase family)
MKYKEILKLLEQDGWYFARQKGSHKHYHHPTKKGTVTVPGKPNDDIPKQTERSILKQAGMIP